MERRQATPEEVAAYISANRAFADLVRRTRQLLGCTAHAARDHILARGCDRTTQVAAVLPSVTVAEYLALRGVHVTAHSSPNDPTGYYVYD